MLSLLAWGGISLRRVLLFIAVTALFLSREPMARLLRGTRHGLRPELKEKWGRWLAVTLGAGITASLILILAFRLTGLLWLGIGAFALLGIHTILTLRRQERSIWGELLGVLALTTTGLAAHYVDAGVFGASGWRIWVLSLLYFSSAVFFVKMQIAYFMKPATLAGSRLLNLAYHSFLIGCLIGLWLGSWIPAALAVAYLPILIRATVGSFRFPAKLDIKRLGYLEVCYTVFFVVVAGLALRLAA